MAKQPFSQNSTPVVETDGAGGHQPYVRLGAGVAAADTAGNTVPVTAGVLAGLPAVLVNHVDQALLAELADALGYTRFAPAGSPGGATLVSLQAQLQALLELVQQPLPAMVMTGPPDRGLVPAKTPAGAIDNFSNCSLWDSQGAPGLWG